MGDDTAVDTGNRRALLVFAAIGLVLAVVPSEILRLPDSPAIAVPSIGFVAGFVLLSPLRWQLLYLALGAAGAVGVRWRVWDGSVPHALISAAAVVTEVTVLAVVARLRPAILRIDRRIGVLQFFGTVALAVAAAESLAALAMAFAPPAGQAAPPWPLTAAADLVSISLFTPVFLALPALQRLERGRVAKLAGTAAVVLATAVLAFGHEAAGVYIRPYLTVAMVVFATAWLGVAAAAVLPIIVVGVSGVVTAAGTGPFWSDTGEGAAAGSVFTGYALITVVGAWLVAATVAERAAVGEVREREVIQLQATRVELEAERQRTRLAQEIARLGSWEIDLATEETRWSAEVFRIAGREPVDAVLDFDEGRRAVHPDDLPALADQIATALTGGDAPTIEIRMVRPDGEIRWVQTGLTAVDDHRCVGFSQDITDRRLREDRLAVQAEVLEHMAQGVAIIRVDQSGDGVLYTNPRFRQDFGHNGDGTGGDGGPRVAPDGTRWCSLGELATEADDWDGDVQARRPDGTQFTAHLTLMPLELTEHGRVAVVLESDVTERRQQERALRESEQRLRLTHEHAPIGMGTLDLDGRWVQVNSAMSTMLGRSRNELERLTFLDVTHPDDRDAAQALVGQLLDGEIGSGQVETRYLRPDGEILWAIVNVTLLRDSDRSPRFFIAQVVDITDRRLDEERLRRSAEGLREASRAKTQFLSRMSHELRTPLNAVLGYAQLLDADPGTTDHEAVDQILRAGKHLLGLIDEVLDITSVESGALKLDIEPVAVDPLVNEAVQLTQPFAADHDVELEVAAGSARGAVARADQQRLTQILLNLLSNAIKYNHPGGRVTVTAATGPDQVTISVTDTGSGIPADSLDEVFQPFARLDADALGIQGSGIGLPLARTLAERMDGSLRVSSELGRGSTFVLSLPSATERVAATGTGAPGSPAEAPASRPVTVVSVEDNEVNRRLVAAMLRQRPNVHLIEATTAAEGLAAIEEHDPDLVLLDLHLPDMSGLDVLRLLPSEGSTPAPTVAVVSADAHLDQINAALALGATEYLTKPINLPTLLNLVDTVAETRAAALPPTRDPAS